MNKYKNDEMLIMYYSWSGNTDKIANVIHHITGCEVFKVEPQSSYSSNYNECVSQARKEIQKNTKPKLKEYPHNIEKYKVLFIGTPNWCSTMAPPINTILSEYDLSGKIIVPFITHGGGGSGHFIKDLNKLCPNSIIYEPFVLFGNRGLNSDENVRTWLKNIDII